MTVNSNQCSTKTGLYCETYGRGDPILFVHGFGASSYSWRNLIDPLKNEYQLFLIDLKGFGRSPKPKDKKYSLQDHADLLYEFILEQDLTNLTLVGNSYGGAVSLMLAIMLIEREPTRLSKLILIDTVGYEQLLPWHFKLLRAPIIGWLALRMFSVEKGTRRVLKFAYHNDLITEEQVARYAEGLTAPGAKSALLSTARQAIPKNPDEIIANYPKINVPTLIVWGEKDKIIPLKIGQMLKDAIPTSKLVVIPECGHAPQEETPERTIPIIKSFLKNSLTCPE